MRVFFMLLINVNPYGLLIRLNIEKITSHQYVDHIKLFEITNVLKPSYTILMVGFVYSCFIEKQ